MTAAFDFDLFTIGEGSGGVRASRFAANLGARVAIAKAGPFGGTGVNVGCVPKQLMSIAAHFHGDQSDAVGFGWEASALRSRALCRRGRDRGRAPAQ